MTEIISGAQKLQTASTMSREGRMNRRQMDIAAQQREVDRKERLARALASQNAGAGAAGIKVYEGSPLSVMNEDIRREENATDRDAFNIRMSQLTQRMKTKRGAQATRLSGGMSIVKGIGDVYTMGAGGGV